MAEIKPEIKHGTFRCILMTPAGRVLDCRMASLILPTHDGQWGFMRNHAPLLCKLDMGIMHVKEVVSEPDSFYFINGGFARVSENNITVLTEEAIAFHQMPENAVQELIKRAQALVAGSEYIRAQTKDYMDQRKAGFLVKLAQLSGFAEV